MKIAHIMLKYSSPILFFLFFSVLFCFSEYCENKFKNFSDVCTAAGWNLDRVQLSVGHYRCQWSELMEVVD